MAYDVHRCHGSDSHSMGRSLRRSNGALDGDLLEELLEDDDCLFDTPRPLNEVEAFAELSQYADDMELELVQCSAIPPGSSSVGHGEIIVTITAEEAEGDPFVAYALLRERYPLALYEVVHIELDEEDEDTDYVFRVVRYHHAESVGSSDRQHWLVFFDAEALATVPA